MKVYRVITRFNYSHPMLFVVDNISDIEKLYKKTYPEGSEILTCELIEGQVLSNFKALEEL